MKSSQLKSSMLTAAILLTGASSFAQDKRFEVNPFIGYTMSDGVTTDPFLLNGVPYDAVNVASGLSYGVQFGYFATEQAEIGFLWSRQESTFQTQNGSTNDVTDLGVANYHAIFTYNWFDETVQARPFLFGGVGATSYKPADIGGQSIDGETQFSSMWGGGVKVYPGETVGFTAMARWTPTYIKSDPAGIWCSPYWFYGCYVVGDSQFANQFELSGGVTFRF